MKAQAMASAVRLTLTRTELHTILNLARFGKDALAERPDLRLDARQEAVANALIEHLELALADIRLKQAARTNRRNDEKFAEQRRREREHHGEVDGWRVIGFLGDWADKSTDPDYRLWVDANNPDSVLPDQCEIRRNVWRIYLTRGHASDDSLQVLRGDCTQTADRAEIKFVAKRIIAQSTTSDDTLSERAAA